MEEGINEGPTLCRIQAPSHWANSREESLRPQLWVWCLQMWGEGRGGKGKEGELDPHQGLQHYH